MASKEKKCARCGAKNRADATFCFHCRAPFQAPKKKSAAKKRKR